MSEARVLFECDGMKLDLTAKDVAQLQAVLGDDCFSDFIGRFMDGRFERAVAEKPGKPKLSYPPGVRSADDCLGR